MLEDGFVPAKRQGYIEFNGSLIIRGEKGDLLFIHCFPNGDHPVTVHISDPGQEIAITEMKQKKYYSSAQNEWQTVAEGFDILKQSEMTDTVIQNILLTGNCGLPSYESSMKMHIPLLNVFLEHYNGFIKTPENLACPVT
jgi:hypothetical protein